MRMKLWFNVLLTGIVSGSLLAGCGSNPAGEANAKIDTSKLTLHQIEQKAKQEGEINSVGMPDTWANWKETWDDLNKKYGLKHKDTDMSSAEELAKFDAEKNNASADIGDVGIAFGPLAKEKGLTLPYKTSYWNKIPSWAKDPEGHWVIGYTGTIAFIIDKHNVKNPPQSWADLKNGHYKVTVGDVMTANQAQFAVLAAAYANGGNEKNIEPGIRFFSDLAKQKRLGTGDISLSALEKGEIDVGIVWDFNGLGYREKIDPKRFEVVIPREASVMSGYTTIINKYSKHPYSAMLAREYELSDKGQINLARGYARPIRSDVRLPEDVKSKLLPDSMYRNVYHITDFPAWENTTKQLPQLWQEQVLIHVK